MSLMFKFWWETPFFESGDTEVFKAARNKLFASKEKQIDNHPLMLDMLHLCRSVYKLGEIKFIDIMLHYMVCSHGKVIVTINSFTDAFIAVTINIHNKVSFNIECSNVSGAQLKEAGNWLIQVIIWISK